MSSHFVGHGFLSKCFYVTVTLALCSITVCAQYFPLPPIAPTKPDQCAAFAQSVSKYMSNLDAEHTKCLQDHRADVNVKGDNKTICSRWECQSLHDKLYGDPLRFGSQKYFEKETEACYAEVKQAEEKEKQRQQEALERAERQRRDLGLNNPGNGPQIGISGPRHSESERNKKAEDDLDEQKFDKGKDIIDAGLEDLQSAIEKNKVLAQKSLTSSQFRQYVKEADDTKSVLSGIGSMLKIGEYGILIKNAYEADPGANRTYHEQALAGKFITDVAKFGLGRAVTTLLPRCAPYFAGGPITAGVSIALGVERTTDFSDIILNTSGMYSLEDKQHALYMRWKSYDQTGATWTPNDRRQLMHETDIVYQEALRKKASQL